MAAVRVDLRPAAVLLAVLALLLLVAVAAGFLPLPLFPVVDDDDELLTELDAFFPTLPFPPPLRP